MHLCYVDESGTPELPGTSNHYVLAGLALPIWEWREADAQVNRIAIRYDLSGKEIHTAWLLRNYPEQDRIGNFINLNRDERRNAVLRERAATLLRTRTLHRAKALAQQKKTYKGTEDYIHLTRQERADFILDVAYLIRSWKFASLFAECIDKTYFLSLNNLPHSVDEQAFEQLISRFERFLHRTSSAIKDKGMVLHDNNQTVARKHTDLMRRFHERGTLWTTISRIIETPLFVDSKLTSMVQMADLCSYALRRYLENDDTNLFDIIFDRADKVTNRTVGVRHFGSRNCQCKICASH